MRCDLHCPDQGGGILAATTAAAGALAVYVAAEVVESMLLAIFIAASLALAAGSVLTVRVLRSHRGTSYASYEPRRVLTVPSVVVRASAPHELGVPRRAIPPARTTLYASPEASRAPART